MAYEIKLFHFKRTRKKKSSFNKETHILCFFFFFLFQSLIFLGCVAAAGLGVNLLCLAIYLSCLCCCRKDEEEEESKKSNSCCVTWAAVAAGLICWYVPPTVLTREKPAQDADSIVKHSSVWQVYV